MASDFFSHWGGTIGLGILALFAMRMLSKGMTPVASQVAAVSSQGGEAGGGYEDEEEIAAAKEKLAAAEPTVRDELQTMVRDNPEMAATLLGRWIVNSK